MARCDGHNCLLNRSVFDDLQRFHQNGVSSGLFAAGSGVSPENQTGDNFSGAALNLLPDFGSFRPPVQFGDLPSRRGILNAALDHLEARLQELNKSFQGHNISPTLLATIAGEIKKAKESGSREDILKIKNKIDLLEKVVSFYAYRKEVLEAIDRYQKLGGKDKANVRFDYGSESGEEVLRWTEEAVKDARFKDGPLAVAYRGLQEERRVQLNAGLEVLNSNIIDRILAMDSETPELMVFADEPAGTLLLAGSAGITPSFKVSDGTIKIDAYDGLRKVIDAFNGALASAGFESFFDGDVRIAEQMRWSSAGSPETLQSEIEKNRERETTAARLSDADFIFGRLKAIAGKKQLSDKDKAFVSDAVRFLKEYSASPGDWLFEEISERPEYDLMFAEPAVYDPEESAIGACRDAAGIGVVDSETGLPVYAMPDATFDLGIKANLAACAGMLREEDNLLQSRIADIKGEGDIGLLVSVFKSVVDRGKVREIFWLRQDVERMARMGAKGMLFDGVMHKMNELEFAASGGIFDEANFKKISAEIQEGLQKVSLANHISGRIALYEAGLAGIERSGYSTVILTRHISELRRILKMTEGGDFQEAVVAFNRLFYDPETSYIENQIDTAKFDEFGISLAIVVAAGILSSPVGGFASLAGATGRGLTLVRAAAFAAADMSLRQGVLDETYIDPQQGLVQNLQSVGPMYALETLKLTGLFGTLGLASRTILGRLGADVAKDVRYAALFGGEYLAMSAWETVSAPIAAGRSDAVIPTLEMQFTVETLAHRLFFLMALKACGVLSHPVENIINSPLRPYIEAKVLSRIEKLYAGARLKFQEAVRANDADGIKNALKDAYEALRALEKAISENGEVLKSIKESLRFKDLERLMKEISATMSEIRALEQLSSLFVEKNLFGVKADENLGIFTFPPESATAIYEILYHIRRSSSLAKLDIARDGFTIEVAGRAFRFVMERVAGKADATGSASKPYELLSARLALHMQVLDNSRVADSLAAVLRENEIPNNTLLVFIDLAEGEELPPRLFAGVDAYFKVLNDRGVSLTIEFYVRRGGKDEVRVFRTDDIVKTQEAGVRDGMFAMGRDDSRADEVDPLTPLPELQSRAAAAVGESKYAEAMQGLMGWVCEANEVVWSVILELSEGRSPFAGVARLIYLHRAEISEMAGMTDRVAVLKRAIEFRNREFLAILSSIPADRPLNLEEMARIENFKMMMDIIVEGIEEYREVRDKKWKDNEVASVMMHDDVKPMLRSLQVLSMLAEDGHAFYREPLERLVLVRHPKSGSALDIVNDIVAKNAVRASHKKVDITVDIPEDVTIGDFETRHQIIMILSELVYNAIKYSDPQKVERWVKIRWNPETRGFVVEDNGVGIEDVSKVFNGEGYREPQAAAVDEGKGTGLRREKENAERIGWDLFAESEGIGKGSRFILKPRLETKQASDGGGKPAHPPVTAMFGDPDILKVLQGAEPEIYEAVARITMQKVSELPKREDLEAIEKANKLPVLFIGIESLGRRDAMAEGDAVRALGELREMTRRFRDFYREPSSVDVSVKMHLILRMLDYTKLDEVAFREDLTRDMATLDQVYRVAQVLEFIYNVEGLTRGYEAGKYPSMLTDLLLRRPGKCAISGSCHPTAVLASHFGKMVGLEFGVIEHEGHVNLYLPVMGGIYVEPSLGNILTRVYFEERRRILSPGQQPQPLHQLINASIINVGNTTMNMSFFTILREMAPDARATVEPTADFLVLTNRPEEAVRLLEVHVRENPNLCSAKIKLSRLYIEAKRYDDAIAVLTDARELLEKRLNGAVIYRENLLWLSGGEVLEVYFVLSRLYSAAKGDLDKGIEVLEKGITVLRDSPPLEDALAKLYEARYRRLCEARRFDEAKVRDVLVRLLDIDPEDISVYKRLARLSFESGRYDEAAGYWLKLIDLEGGIDGEAGNDIRAAFHQLEEESRFTGARRLAKALGRTAGRVLPDLAERRLHWRSGTATDRPVRSGEEELDSLVEHMDIVVRNLQAAGSRAIDETERILDEGYVADLVLESELRIYGTKAKDLEAANRAVDSIELVFKRGADAVTGETEVERQRSGLAYIAKFLMDPSSPVAHFSDGRYPFNFTDFLLGRSSGGTQADLINAAAVLALHLGHVIDIDMESVKVADRTALVVDLGEQKVIFDPTTGELIDPATLVAKGLLRETAVADSRKSTVLADSMGFWVLSGSPAEARGRQQRYFSQFPEAGHVRLYYARLFAETGDLGGAIEIVEDILAGNPRDIDAMACLVGYLYAEGESGNRLRELIPSVAKLQESFPVTDGDRQTMRAVVYPYDAMAYLYYIRGLVAVDEGDMVNGIRLLGRSLEMDINYTPARSKLVEYTNTLLERSLAAKNYGMVVEMSKNLETYLPADNPRRILVYWFMGYGHWMNGNYEEAARVWNGHVRESNEFSLLIADHIVRSRMEGQNAEADRLLERAITFKPEMQELVTELEGYYK